MSFANALKKKSETILSQQPVIVRREKPIDPPLIITVERVLNKNRIDVFFSNPPVDRVVQMLQERHWSFRHEDKAWFNSDTYDNRLFCEQHLGASFDEMGDINAPITEGTETSEVLHAVTLTGNVQQPMKDFCYETYKLQCRELQAHFKCEFADLAIVAINHFHKATFSRDS